MFAAADAVRLCAGAAAGAALTARCSVSLFPVPFPFAVIGIFISPLFIPFNPLSTPTGTLLGLTTGLCVALPAPHALFLFPACIFLGSGFASTNVVNLNCPNCDAPGCMTSVGAGVFLSVAGAGVLAGDMTPDIVALR